MEPGIYILLLCGEGTVRVGSLGIITFSSGYYGYVGSALGPGGLARVSRHIRVATGGGIRPRWHIDYLLMSSEFRLMRVYCALSGERLECPLAQAIALPYIPNFGSSDCRCNGHLFFSPNDPGSEFLAAFESVGLHPQVRHL